MRYTLIIASMLLAIPLAGCGKCDWEGAGTHYQCEHPDDMAKANAKWDADKARDDAETEAYLTRSAIEQNTQELQQLNADMERRRLFGW